MLLLFFLFQIIANINSNLVLSFESHTIETYAEIVIQNTGIVV